MNCHPKLRRYPYKVNLKKKLIPLLFVSLLFYLIFVTYFEAVKKQTKILFSSIKYFKPKTDSSIACTFRNGRLGNQMSNFATLFALGQDHNLLYFVTSEQLQMMEPIFRNSQNFSKNVRLIEDFDPLWQLRIWTNPFPLVDSFLHYHDYSNATIWQMYAKDHFLDIGDFPNDVSIFKKYLKEIRNIFQISDWLVRKAQDRLRKIGIYHCNKGLLSNSGKDLKRVEDLTFVSIHVRMSDYSIFLETFYNLTYISEDYFERAKQYFRDQFPNVIFYVVSDDSAWAENYFENSPAKDSETYFVGFGSESRGSFFHSNQQVFSQTDKIGLDLALLSQANHSIMTYGTFGMWGTMLAGGQATLPSSHLSTKESHEIKDGNMEGWKFI